jgi:hypothetical protein
MTEDTPVLDVITAAVLLGFQAVIDVHIVDRYVVWHHAQARRLREASAMIKPEWPTELINDPAALTAVTSVLLLGEQANIYEAAWPASTCGEIVVYTPSVRCCVSAQAVVEWMHALLGAPHPGASWPPTRGHIERWLSGSPEDGVLHLGRGINIFVNKQANEFLRKHADFSKLAQ